MTLDPVILGAIQQQDRHNSGKPDLARGATDSQLCQYGRGEETGPLAAVKQLKASETQSLLSSIIAAYSGGSSGKSNCFETLRLSLIIVNRPSFGPEDLYVPTSGCPYVAVSGFGTVGLDSIPEQLSG